jgi:hypothetical protein
MQPSIAPRKPSCPPRSRVDFLRPGYVGTLKTSAGYKSSAYCIVPNKTFLVRLKSDGLQHVRAATVEMHGEHLVFLTAKGELAALFFFAIIESWNEIAPEPNPPAS